MLRKAGLSILAAMCLAHLGCRAPMAGGSGAADPAAPRTLAVVGARIYPSPVTAPVPDGVVLVVGDRISAVGRRDQVAVPAQATVLDGAGLTVTAGFWNAHVHFTGARVADHPHDFAARGSAHD